MALSAIVAGVVVYFGVLSTCQMHDEGGEKYVPSGTDMDFERSGWLDDHRFSERCHYDHDNDIVIMDLEGDGFGENAIVVYDFKRGLFTYVLQSQNKCFLGSLNQDDIDGFRNAHDGETIELGAVKPRYFITNLYEIIPPAYLVLTTSPVVNDLCLSKKSQWIEPVVDDGDTVLSRQKRSKRTNKMNNNFVTWIPDGTRISC